MDNKNNKLLIILLSIIIVILAALCVLFATGTISFKNNEGEPNTNSNELNTSEVKSFLITNNFISKHDAVSDVHPDGYVFLENGNFSYYKPEFYRYFVDSEENRLISFIGTWTIKGNKLVLNVTKEEYAIEGKIIDRDEFGKELSNYKKTIKDVSKTIEYTINKIDNTSEHLPFISLSSNGEDIKWYSLPGVDEDKAVARSFATNGYIVTSNDFIGKYENPEKEYFILKTGNIAELYYMTGEGFNTKTANYFLINENGKTILKFDSTSPYWRTLDLEETNDTYKFTPREFGPGSNKPFEKK